MGLTSSANLRPSQQKLDRLERAAVHAPDREIDAAIRRLERATRPRGRQRFRNLADEFRSRLRKGRWVLSVNLGLISIQRHMSK